MQSPEPTFVNWSGVLCLFFLNLLWAPQAAAQVPFEPDQFLRAVLERHPSLRKADERVRSAEFGLKASGLQPNPTLTLAATAGDAGESSNGLTQAFEISGQPRLRSEIAKAKYQAAKLERLAAQRRVGALAYRAWLELWKSDRLLEIALLRNQLMQETLRVARRRFEVGEISENESLRVELAAAQASTNRIQAEGALLSAQRTAALLLGPEAQQIPAGIIAWEPTSLLPELDLEEVLAAARWHPTVQAQSSLVEGTEYASELIGKERAPILSLSLYRSTLVRRDFVEQGAQLSVTWPVFDWGNISHRKEQKQAQAEAHRAGIDEMVLQNCQNLSQAWTQLEAFKKERDILTLQAQRYEELAREARVAYDVGLLNLTDVLQTESSYREAGEQLVTIKADILELEIQVLELTGLAFPNDILKEGP